MNRILLCCIALALCASACAQNAPRAACRDAKCATDYGVVDWLFALEGRVTSLESRKVASADPARPDHTYTPLTSDVESCASGRHLERWTSPSASFGVPQDLTPPSEGYHSVSVFDGVPLPSAHPDICAEDAKKPHTEPSAAANVPFGTIANASVLSIGLEATPSRPQSMPPAVECGMPFMDDGTEHCKLEVTVASPNTSCTLRAEAGATVLECVQHPEGTDADEGGFVGTRYPASTGPEVCYDVDDVRVCGPSMWLEKRYPAPTVAHYPALAPSVFCERELGHCWTPSEPLMCAREGHQWECKRLSEWASACRAEAAILKERLDCDAPPYAAPSGDGEVHGDGGAK